MEQDAAIAFIRTIVFSKHNYMPFIGLQQLETTRFATTKYCDNYKTKFLIFSHLEVCIESCNPHSSQSDILNMPCYSDEKKSGNFKIVVCIVP